MEGLIMVGQFLLSLSILIVVHEWGHYITARMFKIKVEKFYLFFDFLFPLANVANFSILKYKKGDTEYGLGWFPLGGYVKIAGMVDESMDKEQMNAPIESWEFRSKPAWQRLIVMLGGIIVNVIVGVVIYIGLTWSIGDNFIPVKYVNTHGGIHALEIGQQLGLQTGDQLVEVNGKPVEDFAEIANPDVLLNKGSSYTVLRNGERINIPIPDDFLESLSHKKAADNFVRFRSEAVVGSILPEIETEGKKEKSFAATIGLQAEDRITEIDGSPVQFQDQVQDILKTRRDAQASDSVSIKVLRAGQELTFQGTLVGGAIGYFPKPIDKNELQHVSFTFGQSVGIGTTRAFDVIFVLVKTFGKIFRGDISLGSSLMGPVGIAKAYGTQWDWERLWKLTGLLSMTLAFMNLLPIPGLDGGYVMFLLYEMVSGRQPSEKFFETALKIGMALLLMLMAFAFYNDFTRP